MHPLTTRIAEIERRLLLRRRAESICRIAAAVIAAALGLGLLDYLFRHTDVGLRLLAFAAFIAVAYWAVDRWWRRGRRRDPNSLSVARAIERRFPQLQDSLASALEFLRQSEEDPTAGSAQLRRLVINETETAVERLPLDDVIDERPLKRAFVAFAAALAVVLFCLAVDARSTAIAVARLVAPLGGPSWPREHYLEFQNPPARLAAGQTFEAELIDRSGRPPDDVRVEYRWKDDGGRQTLVETAVPYGDSLIARRENVRQSFSFRATGGDDQAMGWHDVEVVEPPRAESLTVTIHPPAYTGQPPRPAEAILEILEGSQIEIDGVASEELSSVSVLSDQSAPIVGKFDDSDHFNIPPGPWTPTTNGVYRLVLANSVGVAGIAATWRVRIQPDAPPTVEWLRPAEDIVVLPSASVPIEVLAQDDLALHQITLEYERSPARESTNADSTAESGHVALEEEAASPRSQAGERRIVELIWPLAELAMSPGDVLTLHIEATDFRPATGRTPVARRVSVVTIEELDARLADQQRQIARQLERALASQQSARDEVRRLAVLLRESGQVAQRDRNALQTSELSQRRIATSLTDQDEGIPRQARQLLDQLTMNAIASPDIEQAMRSLQTALADLAAGSLNTAQRELTAARKLTESLAANPQSVDDASAEALFDRSLSNVSEAQDEVVDVVERLVAELSDAADFSRFVRELSQLHSDQTAHEQKVRAEMDLATLPLSFDELSRDQRAALVTSSTSQEALTRRFEKSILGVRRMAAELDLQDAAISDTLRDAVALADELSIAANMQEATTALAANRVATALALEHQSADGIERVLDVLRNRSPNDADRLDEIKRAEAELAALREQLAQLREQAAQPNAGNNPAERERLGRAQQDLRRQIGQLARRLDRLRASGAGASARRAGDALSPPSASDNADQRPQPPQPANDDNMRRADEELQNAQRELAEDRVRAELDLALHFINRFRGELEQMITRQKEVIDQTADVESLRRNREIAPADAAGRLNALAEQERALAQTALEQRETLFGLAAVRVSLQDAETKLASAAERLELLESGDRAQTAEQLALTRLEAMMQAFAETAREAQPPNDNRGGGNANRPPQPQRRPAFELLEVKMLRVMQLELNARTEAHERRRAASIGEETDDVRAELASEARELAAEQARLAELVQEMLSRNNEGNNE